MAEERHAGVVDLAGLAGAPGASGPVWTHQSADLNANLLVLAGQNAIPAHVNDEVDVLLVGVAGYGVVEIDDVEHPMGPGQLLVIPKGVRRAIRGTGDRFAYLTCHRRRAGLWPRNVLRTGERHRNPGEDVR